MTPAQKAGFRIGDRAKVVSDEAGTVTKNSEVQLIEDDGSNNPWWRVIKGESKLPGPNKRIAVTLDFVDKINNSKEESEVLTVNDIFGGNNHVVVLEDHWRFGKHFRKGAIFEAEDMGVDSEGDLDLKHAGYIDASKVAICNVDGEIFTLQRTGQVIHLTQPKAYIKEGVSDGIAQFEGQVFPVTGKTHAVVFMNDKNDGTIVAQHDHIVLVEGNWSDIPNN